MDSFTIQADQQRRYDRHHLIDWWDQKKLKGSKVLVAGAGALGNEVLKNLVLLGVGNITVIDFDTVSITNLTRSVLFRESDIGLPKVEVARQRALEINPEIEIREIHGDLEFDLSIGDVREHNLIIGCLDSVNARWAINQLAYRAGIPWINGGIGVVEGEVSFFDPSTSAACYECSISSQMWERRNQRYSCQGMKRNIPETAMPHNSNNCLNCWGHAGAASTSVFTWQVRITESRREGVSGFKSLDGFQGANSSARGLCYS